ncbi:MAG TPA: glycosyltransferase, partial [Candidatus Limnocylindrales bacterium]|nr:glycosyltransferase [Candidatus Limnocylindrales bacterium]
MAAGGAPLDVLVVGWFPRADDPIAGRFIADQVAALRATGRVRPTVVSADPIALHGDLPLRTRSAEAWARAVRDAAASGSATLASGAFGPDGVPIARLGVPVGRTAAVGRINEHDHRAAALEAFLSGSAGGWPLIHAHVGYPEGAAAARVARARDLPLVLTEHATYLDRLFADPDTRAAYLDGARAASRIVAVGSVLAEQIGREVPELESRIVVIPNTVDVDAFAPVGPADRDPGELLWVGYRREVKGMATLLRAFAAVRAARPSTTLRLIGRSTTDDEEAGWRRLAGELGVADAVRFEPPADRAGVAAAMAHAALFVHPGRRETMGIVAVEALAGGLPVVATDSGGVTEVLGADPDAVGALVPPDEPDA